MKNELLSDHLKIKTLTPHQDLEKVLVGRMRDMRNLDDYISLLQLIYCYFGALEDQINLYIGSPELPDYLQRRKSESLAKDILSLGGTLPEKVALADLPVIKNHLQAFGVMYVMEGSTLGGLVISKIIIKRLGIQDEGLLFFKSYGEHLATMWATFKLTLNRQSDNETDTELVTEAARSAFMLFKQLLERSAAA